MSNSTFGSIDRLPSGNYRARYLNKHTGERISAPRTYKLMADADAWLTKQRRELDTNTWRDTRHSNEPLETYARRWIEQRGLKPSSIPDRIRIFENYIFPYLGDVPISEITPAQVRTWRADLSQDRPGKKATLEKATKCLRAVMSTALADELINRNPCNIKSAGNYTAPRRTVLTVDEVATLAGTVLPRYSALVNLLAWCALRIGEATALRIKDIALDAQTLTVSRRVKKMPGGVFDFDTPKSAKGVREVDIPPHLIPILQAHIDAYGQRDSDALIFTTRNGVPAVEGGAVAIKKALVAIGKPSMTTHDLRHTASTRYSNIGANPTEIMQRNGQSDTKIAMHYVQSTTERNKELAQRLSDLATTPDNVRYLPTPVPGDAVVNQ